MCFFDILTAIWKVFSLEPESALWLVPCRNEDKRKPWVMGLRQKQDLWIWWCAASTRTRLPHQVWDLESIWWKNDETKRVGQTPGKWELGNSKSEVENSQVSWQEKNLQAVRILGDPMWKSTDENKSVLENQHHSLTSSIWVSLNGSSKQAKILWTIAGICLNPGSSQEQKKKYLVQEDLMQTWSYEKKSHARNVWSGIASWSTKQLNSFTKVATPCIDDHQFKEEEKGTVGEWSKVFSQIVLKCPYVARIGRPHIFMVYEQICSCGNNHGKDNSRKFF